MQTRRAFLGTAAMVALAGCGGNGQTPESPGGLTVTSPAFDEGESIPAQFTVDGADESPPLHVEGVPDGARTLALVVDDPDAPSGTFTHWLVWSIPADRTQLRAGIPQQQTVADLGSARQGTNDFGEIGYRGPAPPEGDGPHTYRFTVYALDADPDLAAGAERGALETALTGTVIASGRLTGEYER